MTAEPVDDLAALDFAIACYACTDDATFVLHGHYACGCHMYRTYCTSCAIRRVSDWHIPVTAECPQRHPFSGRIADYLKLERIAP